MQTARARAHQSRRRPEARPCKFAIGRAGQQSPAAGKICDPVRAARLPPWNASKMGQRGDALAPIGNRSIAPSADQMVGEMQSVERLDFAFGSNQAPSGKRGPGSTQDRPGFQARLAAIALFAIGWLQLASAACRPEWRYAGSNVSGGASGHH
jgi:hypothetical protein